MSLCECGCGELAPIAKRTRGNLGHVKGQPIRFAYGHGTRGKPLTAEHRARIAAATTIYTPERAIAEGWLTANESGLCECGCGEKAPLAQGTSRATRRVKGYPTRFVRGHSSRGRPSHPWSDESRAKLSASLRGKPKPPGFGAKMSARLTGVKMPPRTPEHLAKISAALKGSNYGRVGEKAGNWRGGINPAHLAARATPEYKEWRTAVYERDGYTCQHCGQIGRGLHAHHIKPFATNPELRTALENGVTLCKACHETAHFGPTHQRKKTTAHA